MGKAIEERFEEYSEKLVEVLEHEDRQQPARWYLKGLILPGERKSIEPMAARVCPNNVRSAHQSMHHLVAMANWSDQVLLQAVAQEVVPKLHAKAESCWWILDDTGHAKKGTQSVGVARQYCGRLGKTENCQVAVSLSFANAHGSLPLAYEMYLPKEWAEDEQRRAKAGVPEGLSFRTKGEIAREQIKAAIVQRIPRGVVLADAAYGDETQLRDYLTREGLQYAVNIRAGTTVWWGTHQPCPNQPQHMGRPRTRMQRDKTHQPIDVLSLARQLPASTWQEVKWREGTKGALSSRFARVRVRAAHRNKSHTEEWLLIEWPMEEDKPVHYWLSTLDEKLSMIELVAQAKGRWMIERDYQELKSELGLSHFEGRNWRGFHHHATLCIAAYGFLMLERLQTKKKSIPQLQAPSLPKNFRPRGGKFSHATSRTLLDCNPSVSSGLRYRKKIAAMSVLWPD